MNKQFKNSVNRSVYMPEELIEQIQAQADGRFSNFNRVIVEVLLKEFLPKTISKVAIDQQVQSFINQTPTL